MVNPAAAKAAVDTAAVLFDSSIGCCTSPWFRGSCVKGGGTAYCPKCKYHYCRYHYPINSQCITGSVK